MFDSDPQTHRGTTPSVCTLFTMGRPVPRSCPPCPGGVMPPPHVGFCLIQRARDNRVPVTARQLPDYRAGIRVLGRYHGRCRRGRGRMGCRVGVWYRSASRRIRADRPSWRLACVACHGRRHSHALAVTLAASRTLIGMLRIVGWCRGRCVGSRCRLGSVQCGWSLRSADGCCDLGGWSVSFAMVSDIVRHGQRPSALSRCFGSRRKLLAVLLAPCRRAEHWCR